MAKSMIRTLMFIAALVIFSWSVYRLISAQVSELEGRLFTAFAIFLLVLTVGQTVVLAAASGESNRFRNWLGWIVTLAVLPFAWVIALNGEPSASYRESVIIFTLGVFIVFATDWTTQRRDIRTDLKEQLRDDLVVARSLYQQSRDDDAVRSDDSILRDAANGYVTQLELRDRVQTASQLSAAKIKRLEEDLEEGHSLAEPYGLDVAKRIGRRRAVATAPGSGSEEASSLAYIDDEVIRNMVFRFGSKELRLSLLRVRKMPAGKPSS